MTKSINDYHIEDGVMYLSKEQLLLKNGVWEASETAVRSFGVHTIHLPYGYHELNHPIKLRGDVNYQAQRGTLIAINPGSKYAIEIDRNGRTYGSDVWISGISFTLIGKCEVLMYTGTVTGLRIDSCTLDADNLADYSLIVGELDGRGSIDTALLDCKIMRANKYGVYYAQNGSKHLAEICHIWRNKTNVGGYAHRLHLRDCAIEVSGGMNLDILGGVSMSVKNCSFEKGDLKVNNIERLILDDLSRVSSAKMDFSGVRYAKFDGTRLNSCSFTCLPDRIDMVGNYVQPPEMYMEVFNERFNGENEFRNNFTGRNIELPHS